MQSAGVLGNLDSEEQDLISRVVYELNMWFIRVRCERPKYEKLGVELACSF
jgi:hypothetical protein